MPQETPKGFITCLWGEGKGQGLYLQVTVCHITLSSAIQKERIITASSRELSVLVTMIKYLLVLVCPTTDCKGRFGPGVIWRMSEVCR